MKTATGNVNMRPVLKLTRIQKYNLVRFILELYV